jgi:hypothetical protein
VEKSEKELEELFKEHLEDNSELFKLYEIERKNEIINIENLANENHSKLNEAMQNYTAAIHSHLEKLNDQLVNAYENIKAEFQKYELARSEEQ